MILRPFDPWKGQLCTCPPKLSLNPYTGCTHGCLYCYASSYIARFEECRPKRDLHKHLAREALKVGPGIFVAMSNSSDPYPPKEEELRLSRGCLEILKNRKLPVQVVTKSHLVAQDAHLLASMKACVAITVTTLNDSVCRRLEPGAPRPKERILALTRLGEAGVPTSARIDPIIPGINDQEIEDLVAAVCQAGARHITSSTFKARPESLKKIISAFPDECAGLAMLFERGNRVAGSMYLPLEIREQMMEDVRRNAKRAGLSFSTCREGAALANGINCDGSHLLL